MTSKTEPDASTDVTIAILNAAESCFERFGMTKTTMADVARAAKISRATVYRYFTDREALITASIVRRAQVNMGPARAFIASLPTIEEQIVEGICRDVQSGRQDPVVNMLVSPEEMELSTKLLNESGKAIELTYELWGPILSDAQDNGKIRADLDLRLLCEWISEIEIMYISAPTDDDDALDRFKYKMRHFFVPALLPH